MGMAIGVAGRGARRSGERTLRVSFLGKRRVSPGGALPHSSSSLRNQKAGPFGYHYHARLARDVLVEPWAGREPGELVCGCATGVR